MGAAAERKERQVGAEWREAPQVGKVAEKIVKRHHPHLEECPIEYVFRKEHKVSKGKACLAEVKKVSGLNAYLATPAMRALTEDSQTVYQSTEFFVMEVAYDTWKGMNEKERRALIDHELCHLRYDDEEDRFFLVGHDLEEFDAIVNRHGAWRGDVERFLNAAQGRLELVTDPDDKSREVPRAARHGDDE